MMLSKPPVTGGFDLLNFKTVLKLDELSSKKI